MPKTLDEVLSDIASLESELQTQVATMLPDRPFYFVDLFLVGAAKRTLAQSKGFRTLIEHRNFPSATVLLRTQIDTAMRINGLSLMDDIPGNLERLAKGEARYDQLCSGEPKDSGKKERLTDAYLKRKLAERKPWIDRVYNGASDFVHLSFRHLFSAVHSSDDDSKTVTFLIGPDDPERPEVDYLEVSRAFYEASKMTAEILLGCLMWLHQPEYVAAAASRNSSPDATEKD